MNIYTRIACWLVIFVILLPLAWDLLMVVIGVRNASFCSGIRILNKESDGLIALMFFFGGPALGIHIFLLPMLFSWWRHS